MDSVKEKRVFRLGRWWELTGIFKGFETRGEKLRAILDCGILEFGRESRESKILREELDNCEGQRVGILRTDLPEKPLAIRIERRKSKKDVG